MRAKKIIAVYPGRFHPFHKGHYASYMQMVKEFGANNVIIATSGKTEPKKSPFSFDEKREMMILAGVPASKIVYTTNPYLVPEVVGKLSEKEKNETAMVFGVSEKDMSEDPRFSFAPLKSGKQGFYRKYEGKANMEPMGTISETDKRPARGYIFVTKTVSFKVLGKEAKSASEMRQQYASLPKEQEKRFIEELFGKYNSVVNRILNAKLKGMKEEMTYTTISEEKVNSSIIQKMKDSYKGMITLPTSAHRSLSDFLKSLSEKELKMVGDANIKFASAMAWDRLSKTKAGRAMMSEESAPKNLTAKWLQDNLSLRGWSGPDEVVKVTRKARGTGPGGSHMRAKMNNVVRRSGETHKDFASKISQACERVGVPCKIIFSGEETKRDGSLTFWVDFSVSGLFNEEENINEAVNLSQKQINDLKTAYSKIKTIDPSGPSYKKLTDLLDGLDYEDLKKLYNAKINFISSLALNRIMRKDREVDTKKKENDAYRQKLIDGIKETEAALAKEMKYSADLRDKEMVDFYQKHLVKLKNQLKNLSEEMEVVLDLLDEEAKKSKITPKQIKDLKAAYDGIKTIDTEGPSFKKMVGLLDTLDRNDLKVLANANIKFVSPLALNRVMRQMKISHKG